MENKKAYKKPKINKVKLAPDEAVLSGCKGSGPNRNSVKCTSVAACTNRVQGS